MLFFLPNLERIAEWIEEQYESQRRECESLLYFGIQSDAVEVVKIFLKTGVTQMPGTKKSCLMWENNVMPWTRNENSLRL